MPLDLKSSLDFKIWIIYLKLNQSIINKSAGQIHNILPPFLPREFRFGYRPASETLSQKQVETERLELLAGNSESTVLPECVVVSIGHRSIIEILCEVRLSIDHRTSKDGCPVPWCILRWKA